MEISIKNTLTGLLGVCVVALLAGCETTTRQQVFDYVIVGGGTAGSVLAGRLSEDPDITVVVLEAGGPDTDARIYQPTAYRGLSQTEFSRTYVTEEAPELNHRKITWPSGRGWGGSSSINAGVYVRGHRLDYDRWAQLGNRNWGFDDVLPFFRKAENQERGPSEYHGTGGPMNIADPRYVAPIARVFVEAALELGIPLNEDFNGADQEGVGYYQIHQKNGERYSTSAAYLRPALHRSNLRVESRALVTRIVFEGQRATRVVYLRAGRTWQVSARREIILSAGTIESPKLLLLSGVGPAGDLKSLGIPVVADLPGVGKNLQDHVRVGLTYRSLKPLGLQNDRERDQAVREYLLDRSGPLSSVGVAAGAFLKTSPEKPSPDVQIYILPNEADQTFRVNAVLQRPRSRGSLTLSSLDARADPLLQAGYLEEREDTDVLIAGLRWARRLVSTRAFDSFRGEEIAPGPEVQEEEDLRAYIAEQVNTFFHLVGTCKMGSDALAVVNDQLQVRGLQGIRVIDASVMPVIVGGATQAATVMIAERGADLIKRDWDRP